MEQQLIKNGISIYERWTKGRLDHEENVESMIEDMEWFAKCFTEGKRHPNHAGAFLEAEQVAQEHISSMNLLNTAVKQKLLTEESANRIIIGQGQHRVLGNKL